LALIKHPANEPLEPGPRGCHRGTGGHRSPAGLDQAMTSRSHAGPAVRQRASRTPIPCETAPSTQVRVIALDVLRRSRHRMASRSATVLRVLFGWVLTSSRLASPSSPWAALWTVSDC